MKKFIIPIIFLFSKITFAQDIKDWQIGLNFNPFYFTQFSPDFYPEKQGNNFPNGLGYGLTIEKNWNEHFGIKTCFEYSKQNEKFYVNESSDDNTHINQEFEYYKFPLSLSYYYPLSKNYFLTFNQGIQYSFLKYIKIVESGNYQIRTFTPDYDEYIFYQHPDRNHTDYYNPSSFGGYNRNLFGAVGSIGIKGFITEKISFSTNIRYEYDFSNAVTYGYGFLIQNPRATHNFRIGLELGIQYHFSLEESFNKNPHKLF